MAFVAKHQTTGELFTCTLLNIYDIPYHGVKVWDDEDTATLELASFLVEKGIDEPWLWQLCGLDENQLRLCNVKLNNDSGRRIYLTQEGRIEARNGL